MITEATASPAQVRPLLRVQEAQRRVAIEGVAPVVECGTFPAKATLGDPVRVEADIFADGHDQLAARLFYRSPAGSAWLSSPMEPQGNDRWWGSFPADDLGVYRFTIRAWVDHFGTWLRDLEKRVEAGQDVAVDLQIGAGLLVAAGSRAAARDRRRLQEAAAALAVAPTQGAAPAVDRKVIDLMLRYADPRTATALEREYEVVVERERARFSTWYEMFPRSASDDLSRPGTFGDVEARLPYVSGMGFDVLYVPPIHPVGEGFRKGPNNTLVAGPTDPGSPWAIGSAAGGHTAINPDLGTLDDFRRLVSAAAGQGIEIAIDIAFQTSPDHPYVAEHPEWFRQRPDGSIQYAENPPKKYQDIYPFNFESDAAPALWAELLGVFRFWIDQGVRIFRVDNPHTKPFAFWQWVIREVQRDYPDVIFLSEAFTRPKVMYRLAKAGFSQSYNYFPWRNTKWELTSYFTELADSGVRAYFRPNLWPNTPDILTEYLQTGGRPAFLARLVLAATLGASYGIYGPAFELQENRAREPGSEEYLDSEKYQQRRWDIESASSLRPLIARVNAIRRENPALQSDESLRFHPVENDQLICYSKSTPDGSNTIVTVVNLDPNYVQSGFLELPVEDWGLDGARPYQAHDLLGGGRYLWHGPRNYIQLDPHALPAHILLLRRHARTEQDFEYFL